MISFGFGAACVGSRARTVAMTAATQWHRSILGRHTGKASATQQTRPRPEKATAERLVGGAGGGDAERRGRHFHAERACYGEVWTVRSVVSFARFDRRTARGACLLRGGSGRTGRSFICSICSADGTQSVGTRCAHLVGASTGWGVVTGAGRRRGASRTALPRGAWERGFRVTER